MLALETPAPMATGPKLVLQAFSVSVSDEVWPRVLTMEEVNVAFVIALINGTPST